MTQITMTTPGNAGWISYSGQDAEKAKSFYADVLGWNIVEMPMQDGSSHSVVMLGEEPIGGFSPMPEDGGAWTVFITVEDVDGATEKARAAGADVTMEPMDMPGVGRMAQLVDPQGARFAMITYESMQG